MTKLLIFLSVMLGLVLVMVLNTYKGLPLNNDRFNLVAAEKAHEQKVALAKSMEEAKEKEEETAHLRAAATAADLVQATGDEKEVEVAASTEVKIPLDTEELKNGYAVFHSKGKCVTCHGTNGEGKKSQQAPKLAGQYDWYLNTQLVNMKSKVRENKKMDPYLKNLDEKDIKDVATYLSKLPN